MCVIQRVTRVIPEGGAFHLCAMMAALNRMRVDGQLTDVELQTSDAGSFNVHRAVMAACSRVFCAMFSSPFLESDAPTVLLRGVTGTELECVVDAAYDQHKSVVSDDNVEQLLIIADYLDVQPLRDRCTGFLRGSIASHNCLYVWRFAHSHHQAQLATAAWKFAVRHFDTVVDEAPDFGELTLDEMSRLLEEETLNSRSKDQEWSAISKWVEKDASRRKSLASVLYSRVRYPTMLDNLSVLRSPLLDLIRSGSAANKVNTTLEPRLPNQALLAVSGWSGGSPTAAVECFDVRASKWNWLHALTDPQGPRAYHALAPIGNNVYMMGGFNGLRYFNSMRCLDLEKKTWSEKGPMNASRCYVSCAVVEDSIFAMGGYDGRVRVNSCERYCESSNQWSMVEPMTWQRSDAHAAVIDQKIFVCGGFDGQECLQTAECYEPGRLRWTSLPNMIDKRSGVGVATLDRVIYAVGGFSGNRRLNTVERFDPRVGSWQRCRGMRTPRSNFGLETLEGALYVAGGFDGVTTIADCECFEPRANSWMTIAIPSMMVQRSALYVCRIDNLTDPRAFCRRP